MRRQASARVERETLPRNPSCVEFVARAGPAPAGRMSLQAFTIGNAAARISEARPVQARWIGEPAQTTAAIGSTALAVVPAGTACCQVPRHRFQVFTRHRFHPPFPVMGAARSCWGCGLAVEAPPREPVKGRPRSAPPPPEQRGAYQRMRLLRTRVPTRAHTCAENAPQSYPAATAPAPPTLPPTPRSQTR